MSDLAWFWVDQAGGCTSGWHNCQGKDIEDPCFGKCITANLKIDDLIGLTDQAYNDLTNFPNYGVPVPDVQGILYYGTGQPGNPSKCLELSGGNSAYGTAIDVWDCNGLVNQAWVWNGDDLQIKLAGHNEPGMCLDLPGGQVYSGNPLWIWGCNGKAEQQWEWDDNGDGSGTIRSSLDWNYCVDVPGGDDSNGNHLWLWQCNGGASQKWALWKGLGVDSGSNRSRNVTKKPAGGVSWLHNMKDWLADAGSNMTMPSDFVWHNRKKEVKDWYAAQLPGPGLPKHFVPEGWTGYNSTGALSPNTVVLV